MIKTSNQQQLIKELEQKNRRLEVEESLEAVRARAMGMHHSDELSEVLSVLFDQFDVLGIRPVYTFLSLVDLDKNKFTYRQTGKGGQRVVAQQVIDLGKMEEWKDLFEGMRDGKVDPINCIHYPKESLQKVWEVFDEIYAALPEGSKVYPEDFPDGVYTTQAYCTFGYLGFDHTRAASGEEKNIVLRFAREFERLYRRFLDLQKAEAQAREAQIETALERVRSRSMAMHQSSELGDLSFELVKQVQTLGIDTWHCAFNIYDEGQESSTEWGSNAYGSYPIYKTPREGIFRRYYDIGQKGETLHVEVIGEDKCADHYAYLCTLPGVGETLIKLRDSGTPFPKSQIDHVAYFKYGYLLFITYEPALEAHDIFKRFARVFEQSYTRFLDLQKAEAQAREAMIENALEKVRSRTMAMQRSEELIDVASVLFQQVKALGVPQWNCGFNIWDIGDKEFTFYAGTPDGIIVPVPCKIPLTEHPVFMRFDESRKRGDDLLIYEKEGEIQRDHYQYMLSLRPGVGDILQSMLDGGFQFPNFQIDHVANFSYGNLIFITYKPFPEMHDAFKRFAKVFEQTYIRFLDLQKAETQAREAQIQLALERVRARTMAMQKSDELREVVATLYEQLSQLNFDSNACNIIIIDNETNNQQYWVSGFMQKLYPESYNVPYFEHSYIDVQLQSWRQGQKYTVIEYSGKTKKEFDKQFFSQTEFKNIPQEVQEIIKTFESASLSTAFFTYGALQIIGPGSLSGENAEILQRFASVFDQTYTRFLDLQKAEAQARESQIEAALERVRSRTMAMHRSEEIADIVGKIFKELTSLDVALNRVLIWIFHPDEKHISWWSANPESETNAESYRVAYNDNPVFIAFFEAWQKRQPLLLYTLGDDAKVSWEDHLFANTELSRLPKAVRDGMRSEKKIFTTTANSDYGLLMAGCFEPFSDEVNDIIQRFGRVFQQSYTRYVDVQKAEIQAREATIEASLEKARGKAMSMHNSGDLIETASLVFIELQKLGINSFRTGVGLLTKENRNVKLYSATSSENGASLSVVGWDVLDHHPVLSKTYDSWVNNEDFFPLLKGDILKSYYENIGATFTVPVEQSEGYEQHGYFLPFSEGMFYGWSEKPYTEEEIKILHRFRGIVDLTFRRYIELQKSEVNAKEAIRQASLDRVRAEIASMRTTVDLDRIIPLIWKELNTLNISFVRCGVFIMDDRNQQIHTFLSSPDGKAIAAFRLPYEAPGNVGEILKHWQNKQTYISHWDKSTFTELGELLVQQGAIPLVEVYMGTIPPDGIHLHCLPFMQGMLYVGNTTQLKEEDIHLIHSVADAFSTAYARYEDFNKLESANAQIEKTLTDLKLTQNQLVQSEKMASLGELTASIAHEIQNPLNFVNNFSEVSNEMLEELKEEIQKGNYDEIRAITNNIKENLEKILHHGKRADGIVKSMLQHSRSSSGVKEPTDINALADEYLRLAYHGYRAKDKSFNASTNTDLDRSIGKINVVPQDIGRVVLNLITNAFYAVTVKQQQTTSEYRPTVHLSTKKHNSCVLISVKDNGNGIPPQIREKIFQPFFTTKPTGQGTGLGLSVSYDIVKAHGGELKVETMEGEGSEFTISIMA